jgi:hypothetical protein
VESISKSALLSLLRRQSLHWLQIEVVVQVQEVEILTMDEQVQHVVALTADLQACLNPVELGQLEEFHLLALGLQLQSEASEDSADEGEKEEQIWKCFPLVP